MIPYGRQSISDQDIQSVVEALSSDFLTQGPRVLKFEEELANYFKSKYAVCFNSGTSALHAVYHSIGLEEGDEFITTPNSFVATANAGLYVGAKPVFVDVGESGNLDEALVSSAIGPKTKAIVPVHYSGNPVEMKVLHSIAKKHQLFLIEDACHAVGASYDGFPIGSCQYSDVAVFSFHPVKHMTTGEGGAVLTNSKELYEKMLSFRSHGINKSIATAEEPWLYSMDDLGFNYRITDIQCALGSSQLKKLPSYIKRRRQIAKVYDEAFADHPLIKVLKPKADANPSYHLYPILLQTKHLRSHLFHALRADDICCQVHYIPIPSQPYYQKLGYEMSHYPVAQAFYERELSIPMFPDLGDVQIQSVIKKTLEVVDTHGGI